MLTINNELKGIEITFTEKPETAVIESLKAAGFRWHRVKKLWYAKNTAERLALAEKITAGEALQVAEVKKKVDSINLENLGVKPEGFSFYGSTLAGFIRADLKKRGVTGVTVRSHKITHDTGITVTVKATADDISSIEEYQKRYTFGMFCCDAESGRGVYDGSKWIYSFQFTDMTDAEKEEAYNLNCIYALKRAKSFSTHWTERKSNPEFSQKFYEKLVAVFKIANQWNYDNSDSMTDYFDVGYYLDIDIKLPEDFEPRQEMTDEERSGYEAEIAAEEAERQAKLEKLKKEEEERKEKERIYQEKRRIDREKISENIKVVDLEKSKHIYVTDLVGGAGKECNLSELDETINSGHACHDDAVITRKVIFSDRETFEIFGRYLLDDFAFLEGRGGMGTEDIRLQDFTGITSRLTSEQRKTIKFYVDDSVGVYVGDDLVLIIDPEGFAYARYCYRLTESSKILTAEPELQRQKQESEEKTPFYFPEPVEEQIKNISIGDQITVYQDDGWNLCSVYSGGGCGTVTNISIGNYAQYKGIYITVALGRKTKSIFIRNGKECLIYKGIKQPLQKNLTCELISEGEQSATYKYYKSDTIFKNIIKHYGSLGEKPLIDTIQR